MIDIGDLLVKKHSFLIPFTLTSLILKLNITFSKIFLATGLRFRF